MYSPRSTLLVLLFCTAAHHGAAAFTCAGNNDATTCSALGDLYRATSGTGWLNNTGWNSAASGSATDYCTFYGALCSNGALTTLKLQSNNLTGTIPSSLGNLPALRVLYMHNNGLSSTIPSSLGNLSTLRQLYLGNNTLNGTVPTSVWNMTGLYIMYLGNNAQLGGSIATSLCSMTALSRLLLLNSALSGTIPGCLGSLTAVTLLNMKNNQLSGVIPPSVGSMSALTYLDLDANQLTGTIPSSLGSPPNMTLLALNANQLNGTIPSALGSLTALTSLVLSSNALSGSIPYALGNLTALLQLDLSNCSLSGSIPSSLGNLTFLTQLSLQSNALSGTIPNTLANILPGYMLLMRLDQNNLVGTIPTWLANFAGSSLGLAGNLFNGSVPSAMLTYPFNSVSNPCSDPTGTNCTYYDPVYGQWMLTTQPTVVNVPGAFLVPCPSGTYRSGADTSVAGSSYYPAGICSPCALGTVAARAGATFCTACPADTYAHGDGISCDACPTNSISPVSSPSISSCACAFGYATTSLGGGNFSCAQCAAGTFFNVSTTQCQPCSAGFYSSTAAYSCTACPSGYYSNANNTACTPCAAGTYLNSTANACASCPPATISIAAALTCSACAPGSQANVNATACVPCPAGTYLASNGTCLLCAAGQYSPSVSATTCIVNPIGAYSTADRTGYVSCSAGTFLNSTSQTCLACPPATISTGAALACTACPSGSQANVNATACVPCPAGTYLAGNGTCLLCAAGLYSPSTSATSCLVNPTGAYSTTDRTGYVSCGAGTFLNATLQACQACGAGTYSAASAISCTSCPSGYYSNVNNTACTPCAAGTYLNSTANACASCPPATISIAAALACISCPSGSKANFNATACVPCPAGTYLASNGTCLLCDPGQYSPVASVTSCLVNPIGAYSTADRTGYVPCPAGTYLNPATQSCAACALGTFASSNGSATCTTNTPGYYSSADRKSQIACPAGMFLNGTSLMCSYCQLGTFTDLPGQTTCQVNPIGQVSTPQTTLSSTLQMGGVSAASFGAAQNATLTAAIATSLNVSVSSVAITAVADAAAGRRRLASGQVTANFSVTVVGAANASSATASLNATANFSTTLGRTLAASTDPVLSTVNAASISASAPQALTLYLASQPCPAGTYLNGATQNCDACAVGTVAPNTGSTTCTLCPARTVWINASTACLPCPDNSVTSPNSATQCACAPGFYDTWFGANLASPVCAACPLGGVCNTGFVAAQEGWWRESTLSDMFYLCREGNCLAENVVGPLTPAAAGNTTLLQPSAMNASTAPTNCVDGNTGPLCSLCLPGYAVQSGACLPCDPASAYSNWSSGEKGALVLLFLFIGGWLIAFAFFQPLSPRLEMISTTITDHAIATSVAVTAKGCEFFEHYFGRCVGGKESSDKGDGEDGASPGEGEHPAEESHRTGEPNSPEAVTEGASVKAGASRRTLASASLAARSFTFAEHVSFAKNSLRMVRASVRLPSTRVHDHEDEDGDGDKDGDSGSDESSSYKGETGAALEMYYAAQDLLAKAQKYGKILINFFQVVSTFLRSLDVPWPHIFVAAMSKINIINLNLVHLPKAACISPKTSYYEEFNGYTLGLLFALLFIASFWASGVYIIAPISLSAMTADEIKERKMKFTSTCLQRTLMLLFLVYPGVSVAIFGIFSCTQIGGVSYLNQDFNIMCYTRTWWRYAGGAIVWLFLVPVGVPVFFNRLLLHFRVPDMAKLLEDNAWLREAVEHTWRLGMPQPGGVDIQRLCVDNISDEHLAMLHGVLIDGANAEQAADLLAGRAFNGRKQSARISKSVSHDEESKSAQTPVLSLHGIKTVVTTAASRVEALREKISAALNPEAQEKLAKSTIVDGKNARDMHIAQLLYWCRNAGVLSISPISWSDDFGVPEPEGEAAGSEGAETPPAHAHRVALRSCDIPQQLKRASVECGFLFSVYTTKCWYWESVELVRKLILTSILALISPGSAGQVVVGTLVAFFALLGNMRMQPYSESNLNFVNVVAQMNLFFLLFVGLLLKVNLDGDQSASFFTAIVTCINILPVLMPMAMQAYVYLGSFGDQDDLLDATDEATLDD